jgi:hypothetical protein
MFRQNKPQNTTHENKDISQSEQTDKGMAKSRSNGEWRI